MLARTDLDFQGQTNYRLFDIIKVQLRCLDIIINLTHLSEAKCELALEIKKLDQSKIIHKVRKYFNPPAAYYLVESGSA